MKRASILRRDRRAKTNQGYCANVDQIMKKPTVRIIPSAVKPTGSFVAPLIDDMNEEQVKRNDLPINYWGIYLDGKYVSFVSSKELAERTKLWMEKWLSNKI